VTESSDLTTEEPSPDSGAETEEAALSFRPQGRESRLPFVLFVAGLFFASVGLALVFLRGNPGTNDLTDKLLRAGLGPPTLLLFGAGLIAVALFAYDGRRAERRLAEAIDLAIDAAAAHVPPPSPTAPQVPPEVAERLDGLARGVEALRQPLTQIDHVARKVIDGVEATYRSCESVKEKMGRLRAEAGLAGAEDLSGLRTSFEEALQAVRTGIEGMTRGKKGSSPAPEEALSEQFDGIARKLEELPQIKAGLEALRRAAAEERDVSRAVASEMDRLVTAVAERMGAIADGVAAIARASGEIQDLHTGMERLQSTLQNLAVSASAGRGRDPVPSWERHRGESAPHPPTLDSTSPGLTPSSAASASEQGILDAIQRLKALRRSRS